MTFLLDLVIIAIFALTVYFAYKNGFVKTAVSAVSFILAIILTVTFATPLAEYIKSTELASEVKLSVSEAISNSLPQQTEGEADIKRDDIEKYLDEHPEIFDRLPEFVDFNKETLLEWYDEATESGNDLRQSASETLAEKSAEKIIDIVSKLLAVIILFIGAQIILSIIAFILNRIVELPVLRTANKGLGIALGVILAVLRSALCCFVMNLLIGNAEYLNSDFINSLQPENTFFFKLFSNIDIFSFFI